MKKAYISPGFSSLDMELEPLLADSLHYDEIGDQTVTPDPTIEPDEFTSRHNLWNEQEEYDF